MGTARQYEAEYSEANHESMSGSLTAAMAIYMLQLAPKLHVCLLCAAHFVHDEPSGCAAVTWQWQDPRKSGGLHLWDGKCMRLVLHLGFIWDLTRTYAMPYGS